MFYTPLVNNDALNVSLERCNTKRLHKIHPQSISLFVISTTPFYQSSHLHARVHIIKWITVAQTQRFQQVVFNQSRHELINSYYVTRAIASGKFQTQVTHAIANIAESVEGSLMSMFSQSTLKSAKKSAPNSVPTTIIKLRISSMSTSTVTTNATVF